MDMTLGPYDKGTFRVFTQSATSTNSYTVGPVFGSYGEAYNHALALAKKRPGTRYQISHVCSEVSIELNLRTVNL